MGTPLLAVPYLDSLLKEKFNVIGVYTKPPRARGRGMKIEPSQKLPMACVKSTDLWITSQNFWREINLKLILHLRTARRKAQRRE